MDRFRRNLSYSSHLLIGLVGFDVLPVSHGGRSPAMGRVGASLVIEFDPLGDTGFGLRSAFPRMQIDALVFQGPPEPLDEDVVKEATISVH